MGFYFFDTSVNHDEIGSVDIEMTIADGKTVFKKIDTLFRSGLKISDQV
jgi:hypothetical protein